MAANQLLALDVSHWLMGDEAYTGLTSTEVDLPISHTRKQDVVWFYGTIFLGPALVIAAGFAVTRRGRRRGKRERARERGAGPGPGAPTQGAGA